MSLAQAQRDLQALVEQSAAAFALASFGGEQARFAQDLGQGAFVDPGQGQSDLHQLAGPPVDVVGQRPGMGLGHPPQSLEHTGQDHDLVGLAGHPQERLLEPLDGHPVLPPLEGSEPVRGAPGHFRGGVLAGLESRPRNR